MKSNEGEAFLLYRSGFFFGPIFVLPTGKQPFFIQVGNGDKTFKRSQLAFDPSEPRLDRCWAMELSGYLQV